MQGVQGDAPLHVHRRAAREDDHGRHGDGPRPARGQLMCEETLSKRIDVSTVAGTLAVAEQHGCRDLKAACMEFLARPGNLKAAMEIEGYGKVKAIINPVVMMEVVMK
ncbi:hypothetical protein C2845_PM06G30960 [Panicum miliaceum]|uniref:BPM/SPOP BACK domain-containing protein n=1 Tax=Panicum miliaceum TaxID=4540 RepID=A0A3L6RE99_PANMI|nr:hypothetical protein C2845_PM06G30960 [Panicum miliaceum]